MLLSPRAGNDRIDPLAAATALRGFAACLAVAAGTADTDVLNLVEHAMRHTAADLDALWRSDPLRFAQLAEQAVDDLAYWHNHGALEDEASSFTLADYCAALEIPCSDAGLDEMAAKRRRS
jgi:hypothetical protein